MAVYKVAQDVEADDKLIGPFSFRQFIYLIIVASAVAIGWGLAQIFIPLAIIPLPIVLFFGALALPLKKDQPMEIYLAAIISYHLKPRKRLWVPDGVESLVEVTAPQEIEIQRTKDLSQDETERRLSYLASIADTEGWAIRNPTALMPQQSPMIGDVYNEAQQAQDILDTNGQVGQSFDTMIKQTNTRIRQAAVERMHNPQAIQPLPSTQPIAPPDPYANLSGIQDDGASKPTFNPYPSSIHQSIVQPLDVEDRAVVPNTPISDRNSPSTEVQQNTSAKPISPDIISLANNHDSLSIESIAREAHRIEEKEELNEEVVISLR